MNYVVIIRDNASKEERTYRPSTEWDPESSVYWWTEGNMGCDCNRRVDFARAGGPGPEGDPYHNKLLEDSQCGDEAYSVLRAILDDGTIVPLDEAPESRSHDGVQLPMPLARGLSNFYLWALRLSPEALKTLVPMLGQIVKTYSKPRGASLILPPGGIARAE